jgi:hypothetical protein
VPDPRDQPTLKGRALPVLARLMFPTALTELRGMTQTVTESGLNWTLARITNPIDKAATGRVRAGFLGRDHVGSSMTRADIARFLLNQVTADTDRQAAPASRR